MKKSIYLVLTMLLSISLAVNANTDTTGEMYKALRDLGFTNAKGVNKYVIEEKRKYYTNSYGMKFLDQSEVDVLVRDSGLVLSPANEYLSEIPEKNIVEIVSNYNVFKKTNLYKQDNLTIAPDGKMYTKEQISKLDPEDRKFVMSGLGNGVLVIAPPHCFTPTFWHLMAGAGGVFGRDPIVVVRIKDGYIELSRWDNPPPPVRNRQRMGDFNFQ